jgi:hypothetical protein
MWLAALGLMLFVFGFFVLVSFMQGLFEFLVTRDRFWAWLLSFMFCAMASLAVWKLIEIISWVIQHLHWQ